MTAKGRSYAPTLGALPTAKLVAVKLKREHLGISDTEMAVPATVWVRLF